MGGGTSSAYPFPKASLWTQGKCTHAWGSDLEPVRNLLSLSFPFGDKLAGCGRDALVWRIFKILASPLSSPPSSGPRQPRGMLGTQAWALGQVVGGGGASLPLPPHLGLTLAPPKGLGGWKGGKGGLVLGLKTRLRPPPPALLLRPLPAPLPPHLPASAGRYPGPGPLLDPPPLHPQFQTWL